MGMSTSVTNVWTLLSVRRVSISVEDMWFWTCGTDTLVAMDVY